MKLNLGSIQVTDDENKELLEICCKENRSMRNLISTITKQFLKEKRDGK